ncbi:MAG: hypothetical protein HUU21_23870, partial [Polyangiaceae bacterium]|nr:hypothetical protein [Polyangiaceae bacterium]
MNSLAKRIVVAASAVASIGLLARAASADPPAVQTTYVEKPKGADERAQGWAPGLLVGATFNLTNNRSVVGQVDGTNLSAGFVLDGALDFNKGPHELRNTLAAGSGIARTPALEAWVKTRDELAFESIYLYHIVDWFGPFARFAMNTQIFPGSDPRATPTTYAITYTDGSRETITGTRLHLSDPFQPMTLKQSLGVFAQPLNKESILLEARAGLGAQEVLASDVLSLADDAATPDVEVNELASFNQLGAEAVVEASGAIREKQILYKAGVSVLLPLVYSDLPEGDDRNSIDLMNVDIVGALSFKLVEWASLDYQLHMVRQPQLVDAWQIQNNLLFTLSFATGTKVPVPPPPPPCVPVVAPPAPAP